MKPFECRMCGECCFGEGGILVDPEESERIAHFLGLTPDAFLSRFCYATHGRTYVKTGPDNFCIFHNTEKGCRIHHVKPGICSRWPFYPAILSDEENWELAKDACPGINPDGSFEGFVRESKG